jgi:hypothetical protein
LLRRLVTLGETIGIRDICLHTHADNIGLIRAVGNLRLPVERQYADGVLTLKVAAAEPCLIDTTAG